MILTWNLVEIWSVNSSCTCILELYNKDKEKVLIGGYLETTTWDQVLAHQQGSQHYKLRAMSRKDGF